MATGRFVVYYMASPVDRNPRRLGEVHGAGEQEVFRASVNLAKRLCTRKELKDGGLEAVEFEGERRQYGFLLI